MYGLMKFKNNRSRIIFILMACIFWIYIYYNVPVGHDDWTWGSYIGTDRLKGMLKDYNGRYLGSLFSVILVKTHIIRILIMAGITMGINILIPYLIVKDKGELKNTYNNLFLITILLLVLTPINIFKQTFSWISGFSNYIPPIFCILVYLAIARNEFLEKRDDNIKIICIISIFTLSVFTQLFVEHMTLYMIMLSTFIIIYSYIKFKEIYKIDLAAFIGSIVGAGIMFSNGAYHKIAQQEDKYRTMASGISGMIKTAIKQYVNIINKQFFMEIIIIVIILSVIGVVLIVNHVRIQNKPMDLLMKISLMLITIYPIYLLYIKYYTKVILVNETFNAIIQAVLSSLFYVAIAFIIAKTVKNKNVIEKSLFLLGSSLIILCPLTVVTPIGGRNFLASYIFLVVLIIELLNYLKVEQNNTLVMSIVIPINLVLVVMLGIVFKNIGIDGRYREERVISQIQQQKSVIYVPKIRYSEYLQNGNPNFSNNYGSEYGFRAYYNISKDTKVLLGDIKDETNINKYLQRIIDNDYIIILSVKNDASKGITQDICESMKKLGLKESLKNQSRASYIAVIDEKKIEEEEICGDKLEKSINIDGKNINVISAGYDVGNISSVSIDEKEYSINKRGINIVVYDKKAQKVIDSVCFDTFSTGKAYR